MLHGAWHQPDLKFPLAWVQQPELLRWHAWRRGLCAKAARAIKSEAEAEAEAAIAGAKGGRM